ncbi:MAG: DEAD/DEAH box helicase [Chloroflexi bacterium]|nr:DEAD/DEAH box helicase [Chloroflexota bacterium]
MVTNSSTPQFSQGIELHGWQQDALDAWMCSGRGTVKVVTGAGKTILGLSIIERLWKDDPELRVAIVVPTVVLMDQWRQELANRSTLDPGSVGCAGGGKQASYQNGQRVIIWVLPTASRKLADDVVAAGVGGNLLLIVDECHRSGATVMSRIFRTPRKWSLGLSATPERHEDAFLPINDEDLPTDEGSAEDIEYHRTTLGKELGPIVYELSLNRAIELGVLPAFDVRHYGLALNEQERAQYDALSHSITDARRELQGVFGGARKLVSFARKIAAGTGEMAPVARRFINDAQARKRLLFRASARPKATAYLLQEELAENPWARAILFHESIEEVEHLAERLKEELPTYKDRIAIEHSRLPGKQRAATISAFGDATVQVLVSVKSLIEGFNVPAADLGIVVASSTSVRQRVQTMGRVLRRHTTADGKEKHPRMHVFYIRDTVDDAIYGLEDWGKSTGYERNEYFHFLPPDQPASEAGPPRLPLPSEEEIDEAGLMKGDVYPGRYEGEEFTSDTQGNIKSLEGALVPGAKDIWESIVDVRGGPGRFVVTPQRHFVLVRTLEGDSWTTRYVGHWGLTSFTTSSESDSGYSGPTDKAGGEYRVRQRSGRRIVCWEVRTNGHKEEHCIAPDSDDPRSADVSRVLNAVEELQRKGVILRRFQVNSNGDAIGAFAGRWQLLTTLSRPLRDE